MKQKVLIILINGILDAVENNYALSVLINLMKDIMLSITKNAEAQMQSHNLYNGGNNDFFSKTKEFENLLQQHTTLSA